MANNQYFTETLNRLSTAIDLTSPAGLEASAAFDKYVEKIIKPLYPKGAKIRQISNVYDDAGVRTVDWLFKNTNNRTEQAIYAAVNNFVQSWGQSRGLLDDAGNPVPDAGSIPMRVSAITAQNFKGTIARILNPRTAASVAAAVVRGGGEYTIDKNTGKSTWSVPDNVLTPDGTNLARSLRAQVREGDKRWLEGRVALSSLAEGASPASTEERAIAMSNRNYRIMLDKYKAMTPEQEETELRLRLERRARIARYRENYEAANPDDPFVQAKQQKINDRKDKARLLEAKRTPGTPEFEAHVEQELDTRIAREDVTVAWAKKNKKLPQARAILKQNRMKTGTGRALERAKTFMKTAAVGTVISGILGSVIAAVKFLSHVPDILTNVRTIAVKGATLGVTNAQLVRFAALEKRLPGLKEDDISGYLGNLHETLADVAAGGDPEGMLRKLGPLLAIGGDKKLAGKIVAYSTGGYMDTNELGMELLNAVLTTSMQGKTLYGSGYEPSDALRYNAVAFGRATGKPELAYSLNAAYADRNLIPADVAQQIRGVADGKAQVINGQEVAAGRTLLAFLAAIEGRKDTLKTTDTATIVEWKAAEDIAAQWRNLTAAFTEVRTGVLVAIGSTLSGILSFVEGIAKAVLTNPIFKHRFDDMVQGLDERSYYRNVERVKVLDSVTTLSKGLALKGGKSFGDETEEAVAETARKFFSGEGIPAEHVGRKEEFARYMLAIASWYEAENKLNEGKAMVEGYQNMGAEVEYVVRDELGQEKTKSYTYEVGNMNELSDATIPFNMVRARNNVMEGFARYIDFAEKINSKNILDMASLGLDRLVISWLEYVRSLGVEPTPVDPEGFAMFSAVGRYKNAAALSENLKTDGMQMGKPRPAGQEDRYVKGEAGVIISNAVRNEQTKLAQGHTVMHEIRAQVGENVFHGVLENKVEVSGLIKAENKTITVVLTDKATGKELGRAVDVPNIPTADVNLNVEAYMNSFQPAQ